LAVAPLLFMLTLLSPDKGPHSGWSAVWALGTGLLEFALLVGLGRLVLKPLFRLVAQTKSSEFFVAASLLVVIGAASATAALGQSMALGTFIAGLLLAETEFRRQVAITIEPFQGLLLGLFFAAVGARLDFNQIAAAPGLLLGLVAGIVIIKMLVIAPLSRLAGMPGAVAAQTALILAPAGEFALVLIGQAITRHIVAPATGTNALIAATITMFAIPLLVRLSERFKLHVSEEAILAKALPAPEDVRNRVLIVGYGRVGELVGQMLSRHSIDFIAIDAQAGLVARERRTGAPIFFGDARRIELLRHCGIAEARALVVTMDDATAADAVVSAARAERADLTIVARARDAEHARRLYRLGVTSAVPETIESSLQLSEALLVDIGVPMGPVIASVHEMRDEFRTLLQTPTGG
ncbi:MAG: NAD-binding protein, partial [Alphaproteobacteria bacterium]|nr:NAD-binding protein [Alphaproteobacteria bacterium]